MLPDPDPKPNQAPNEVPGTTPDEVTPDQGDTDYSGTIPGQSPVDPQPEV
jgi:hypothetical protein